MSVYYFQLGYDILNIKTLMYVGDETDAAHESFHEDYPEGLVFTAHDLGISNNDVYDYLHLIYVRCRELGIRDFLVYPENATPEQISVVNEIRAFEDRLFNIAQGMA